MISQKPKPVADPRSSQMIFQNSTRLSRNQLPAPLFN